MFFFEFLDLYNKISKWTKQWTVFPSYLTSVVSDVQSPLHTYLISQTWRECLALSINFHRYFIINIIYILIAVSENQNFFMWTIQNPLQDHETDCWSRSWIHYSRYFITRNQCLGNYRDWTLMEILDSEEKKKNQQN